MSDIKRMDIAEFVDEGYLQELNRRFLHPHGLALEVVLENDVPVALGGVWDYRDDPEGIVFADSVNTSEKAARVFQLERARMDERQRRLGYWVQPIKSD